MTDHAVLHAFTALRAFQVLGLLSVLQACTSCERDLRYELPQLTVYRNLCLIFFTRALFKPQFSKAIIFVFGVFRSAVHGLLAALHET